MITTNERRQQRENQERYGDNDETKADTADRIEFMVWQLERENSNA